MSVANMYPAMAKCLQHMLPLACQQQQLSSLRFSWLPHQWVSTDTTTNKKYASGACPVGSILSLIWNHRPLFSSTSQAQAPSASQTPSAKPHGPPQFAEPTPLSVLSTHLHYHPTAFPRLPNLRFPRLRHPRHDLTMPVQPIHHQRARTKSML